MDVSATIAPQPDRGADDARPLGGAGRDSGTRFNGSGTTVAEPTLDACLREAGHAGTRVKLRVAIFRPPEAAAERGTVLFAPNRGEAVELYGAAIQSLLARGLAVLAFDWRGQGGSAGDADTDGVVHIGSFADYSADLRFVARFAEERTLPRPFFVLAVGAGGTAALGAAPSLAREIERMVVVSPILSPKAERASGASARLAGLSARTIGRGRHAAPARLDPLAAIEASAAPAALSAVRTALERERPGLVSDSASFGYVGALLKACDGLSHPKATAHDLPILIIAAGADDVASIAATSRFAEALGPGGFVLVRGAKHALLHERPSLSGLFWSAFDAFVPPDAPRLVFSRERGRRQRRARIPFAPLADGIRFPVIVTMAQPERVAPLRKAQTPERPTPEVPSTTPATPKTHVPERVARVETPAAVVPGAIPRTTDDDIVPQAPVDVLPATSAPQVSASEVSAPKATTIGTTPPKAPTKEPPVPLDVASAAAEPPVAADDLWSEAIASETTGLPSIPDGPGTTDTAKPLAADDVTQAEPLANQRTTVIEDGHLFSEPPENAAFDSVEARTSADPTGNDTDVVAVARPADAADTDAPESVRPAAPATASAGISVDAALGATGLAQDGSESDISAASLASVFPADEIAPIEPEAVVSDDEPRTGLKDIPKPGDDATADPDTGPTNAATPTGEAIFEEIDAITRRIAGDEVGSPPRRRLREKAREGRRVDDRPSPRLGRKRGSQPAE